MLAEIESLLILQDRDQRIQSLEKDLARIPVDQEAAKDRLANDLQAVADAKKAVQENEIAIKSVELDIGTRKDSIAKMKVQQYETKKNDEFTALGNEIERYEQDVDDLETKELELMEKADELRSVQKKAEDALALTQEMVNKEIADLAQRMEEEKKSLDEVREERSGLASNVDEELLSLYDRLMASKGGDAVVSADKGQCAGCHMKLVPATIIQVNAAKEICQCENCGRLLYS